MVDTYCNASEGDAVVKCAVTASGALERRNQQEQFGALDSPFGFSPASWSVAASRRNEAEEHRPNSGVPQSVVDDVRRISSSAPQWPVDDEEAGNYDRIHSSTFQWFPSRLFASGSRRRARSRHLTKSREMKDSERLQDRVSLESRDEKTEGTDEIIVDEDDVGCRQTS